MTYEVTDLLVGVFVLGCVPPVDVDKEDGHGAEDNEGGGEIVTSLVSVANVDVACRGGEGEVR